MQQSFRALGVSAAVEQALADRGIVEPFRIQSLVLPDALAGLDVLAKSPTGLGQDARVRDPARRAVALGRQDPERARARARRASSRSRWPTSSGRSRRPKGIRVGVAYGGTPVGAQAKRLRGAHVLVATPGRLQDLIERRLVSLDGVRTLVLDEADRMLDMGFRPQVERIVRRLPSARQTMLFSATLDGEVGELARAYTRDAVALRERPRGDDVEDSVVEQGSSRSRRRTRSTGSSSCSRPSRGSRSSSCGRSAAPTGSRRSSPGAASSVAAMHGDMVAVPARAGARAVPLRAR